MDELIAKEQFEKAIQNHEPEFEKFFLAQFFGLEFSYGEDSCSINVNVHDFMYNPQGSLHGGIIGLIMDISMGHLIKKFIGTAVTLEMKTQYLKPVRNESITCRAEFLKKGKTIIYAESKLLNEAGEVAAVATATWCKVK